MRVSEGGTGTTLAFTQGSLVFAGTGGTHAQDNSNFYIDDVNNRLCVGTSGATNCTQTLAIGAGKFLVTSAGLATIKGGAVVNTDGGGLTRAQLIEITDAATTKGLQIEAYAAQTANTFEVLAKRRHGRSHPDLERRGDRLGDRYGDGLGRNDANRRQQVEQPQDHADPRYDLERGHHGDAKRGSTSGC